MNALLGHSVVNLTLPFRISLKGLETGVDGHDLVLQTSINQFLLDGSTHEVHNFCRSIGTDHNLFLRKTIREPVMLDKRWELIGIGLGKRRIA